MKVGSGVSADSWSISAALRWAVLAVQGLRKELDEAHSETPAKSTIVIAMEMGRRTFLLESTFGDLLGLVLPLYCALTLSALCGEYLACK